MKNTDYNLFKMLQTQLKKYPNVMGGIVYLPEVGEFIRVVEGSGDNLDDEDYVNEYVDYIYTEIFKMLPEDYEYLMVSSDYTFTIGEGGFVMLKEYYSDLYDGNFAQAIVDGIHNAYQYTDINITQAFYIPEPSEKQMNRFKEMDNLFNRLGGK